MANPFYLQEIAVEAPLCDRESELEDPARFVPSPTPPSEGPCKRTRQEDPFKRLYSKARARVRRWRAALHATAGGS